MIDFGHISQYRENNRIEAKRSLGGLPRSIWETYSAFANTLGGIILLGVEEITDKTFRTVNLPEPEKLIAEFWEIINDKDKVGGNILSKQDVVVHQIGNDRIIAITVPRADRRMKPVYIGTNVFQGTYRRDGEGDYHCTEEEIKLMLRDREERTLDEKVLEHLSADVLDGETIRRYRTYLKDIYKNHEWNTCKEEELLCSIGACCEEENGKVHPTAAGLLMFGFEDEIVKEYPFYHLEYQERDTAGELKERLMSDSGRWSGNLFDFYLRISGKIVRGLPGNVHRAVREAAANCMVNGDYMGSGGIVIIKNKEEICITNPGSFRIDIKEAINGGESDPRNALLSKLFNIVRVGTHAGRGVPDMYAVWKKQGFRPPVISERFGPDRITLKLPLLSAGENAERDKAGMQTGEYPAGESWQVQMAVIDYVTRHINITEEETQELLRMSEGDARRLLIQMAAEGILSAAQEENSYHLKI